MFMLLILVLSIFLRNKRLFKIIIKIQAIIRGIQLRKRLKDMLNQDYREYENLNPIINMRIVIYHLIK